MIASGDKPEPRHVETAGLWARATIATLLLAAAAIITAYTLNADDLFARSNLAPAAPSALAILADPAPPSPLSGVEPQGEWSRETLRRDASIASR